MHKYTTSHQGHTEIVELLLNNKADSNICREGDSPLCTASHEGHTEIVQLLLNNKVDPNICYVASSFIIQLHCDNLCMTVARSGV
jgi:ankyrin repeat protein